MVKLYFCTILRPATMENNYKKNIDITTVDSFSDEWNRFDQSDMSNVELKGIFDEYFDIFPWDMIKDGSSGFDMGCGSGRWARFVAPRVGSLHCIDPSKAIDVARRNLSDFNNITYHQKSVGESILPHSSQDFGYSIGVLHHVPDTQEAIKSCVSILKPRAPLLLYLYYSFDNRGAVFKTLWMASNLFRLLINKLPSKLKKLSTDIIALLVYFPLSYLSKILERIGIDVSSMPLSYYRNHSFYTMRTDSRDRFGTPLESRFSKKEIQLMMESAGLININFSNKAPFWHVVGYKK